MIERGSRRGAGDETTPEHLRESLADGGMTLWAVHDGSDLIAGIFMSVRQYRSRKAVCVEFAAGRDLDMWIGRLEQLWREYRDLVGADTIESACRPGMAKRLKDRGWRRKSIIMELD